MTKPIDVVVIGTIIKETIVYPNKQVGPVIGSPAAYSALVMAAQGRNVGMVCYYGHDMDDVISELDALDKRGWMDYAYTTRNRLIYREDGTKYVEYVRSTPDLKFEDIHPDYLNCNFFKICPMNYALCDRVTVMRDGHLISTDDIQDLSPDMIINKMVGRDISSESYRDDTKGEKGDVMFELKKFTMEPNFRNIDLTIRAGEIVGMAGIGGCGSDSVARCIFGYDTPQSGEMIFKGRNAYSASPVDAIKHHIGYIPKDRDKEGLFLDFDAIWNISSANLPNTTKNGFVQQKVEREAAEDAVKEFCIKIPNVRTHIGDLSGGNRQKVVIAKWIKNESELLIVCSPTRGVDVGAKYEIYRFLDAQRIAGKAILLISDELPELIGMSDRIYALKNGEITGEFAREAGFTEESIMAKMV